MCGFVGFTGNIVNRAEILRKMADRIIHRGPDMEGYHVSGEGEFDSVALGFRRLSIIDLADGAQPMYNEDRTVVSVFNGEIYNFMDIRHELIAKGHVFKTKCDSEVIVHGYEETAPPLLQSFAECLHLPFGIRERTPFTAPATTSASSPITIRKHPPASFSALRSRAFLSIPIFAAR